ncbi:MAG: macro domain-containing protein [Culicoidibacterales bacterium]
MIVQYIKGDIIEFMKESAKHNYVSFFAHGCNCFQVMKSGVARQLAKTYPAIEKADNMLHERLNKEVYYRKNILGTAHPVQIDNTTIMLNLYTQFMPGADLRIDALADAFRQADEIIAGRGVLYIPKIGAGIAGGDWDEIKHIIDATTLRTMVVVIEFDK